MHDLLTVQIQHRKHVLDHADHTAPTRQHELDHTDHTCEIVDRPVLKDVHHETGIDELWRVGIG